MDIAASNGHIHVVQYLHDVNAASLKKRKLLKDEIPSDVREEELCSPSAMDTAAANGHLEVVQWLHTNRSEGCTTDVMDVAAASGHLKVVKWLHYNRFEGCMPAARRLKIRQWLYVNHPIKIPVRNKEMKTRKMHLDFMKSKGEAVKWDQMDVGDWLHERGASTIIEDTASDGHIDALKLLDTNRPAKSSINTLIKAVERGYLEIVL
ncbi:hypothetical protein PHMEG_00016801 [Phytophthora megakarya]|uniref:Uncharacterized protein n=1 Tax=Phytophthora megakarya TaxID=4795 RepID=A0A225VZL4_9STRA|nr:hypothetical protein PHMEG_00016801 [Phytophthora megakarya]